MYEKGLTRRAWCCGRRNSAWSILVIQWGSVLRQERFTEISDIDIAVEGITDPETWSHLETDVLAIVSFPLHLIPFEQVIPVHQQDILSRGNVIYERTN